MRPIIRRGDEVFAQATALPEAERAAALGEGLRRLVESYGGETRPVTMRVLVSPLVTWIWLGAIVGFAGAVLALWPARRGRRSALERTPDVGDLVAARDAKYREIHEAEL